MGRLTSRVAISVVLAILLLIVIGLVHAPSFLMAGPPDGAKQITDVPKGVRAVSPVFLSSEKWAYLIWSTSMTDDEMLGVYRHVHPALTWPKLSYASVNKDIGKASYDGYFKNGRGDIAAAMVDNDHGILIASIDARSGLYPNNALINTFDVTNGQIKLDATNQTIISNATECAILLYKGVAYIACVKIRPMASSGNKSNLSLLVSKDGGKNWTQKDFANIVGSLPYIFSDGNQLFISYMSTEQDRHRSIMLISSDDGVMWSKPVQLFNADKVVQYSIIKRNESLICVLSNKESETNWVPGYVSATAAFNANIITSIQLLASVDNGKTWSPPISLTDGRNADHYPVLTIINNKLYLSYSRITAPEKTFNNLSANVFFRDLGDFNDMMKKLSEGGEHNDR